MSVEDSLFAGTVSGACEHTSSILPKSKAKTIRKTPDVVVSPSGDEALNDPYLSRKEESKAGIWGRVREVPSGCWEWQGATNPQGYGVVGIGSQWHYVHRLVLVIFHGALTRRQIACHSCDNPRCCNPMHLVVGDAADNQHDRLESDGRGRPRKLSDADVDKAAAIRADSGETYERIGKIFGVSGATIRHRLLARKAGGAL